MELLEFLKKHGAYEAFLRNCRASASYWLHHTPRYISNSFYWGRTPEGWEYWNGLNELSNGLEVSTEYLLCIMNNTKRT